MNKMSATSARAYMLDIDSPKKSVFVTQIQEREDEHEYEEPMVRHPVVQEAANKLVETGINTLQKTLLLKKQVEVDKLDEELATKRAEFKERMQKCEERQHELQKKQQEMRDRVTKFDKFIKDSESKRRRAIQKYQSEVTLKEQKSLEMDRLQGEYDDLVSRHANLKAKLKRYRIYEDFLNQVIEILPAHYLEVNDSMINALMMRHRTLGDTNESLVTNLEDMQDLIDQNRQDYKELRQTEAKKRFSINAQLSVMKKEQEHMENQNEEYEQHYFDTKDKLRRQRLEFGVINMAIDNIAEKCLRPLDPPLHEMTMDMKLHVVKEFIIEKSAVVRMVQKELLATASSKRNPSTLA